MRWRADGANIKDEADTSSWYEWSTSSFAEYGHARYSLQKFRKIRKQVALTEHGPTCSRSVAYFRSEQDARKFAMRMGLSVTEYEPAS
jgi:hypothetical protein